MVMNFRPGSVLNAEYLNTIVKGVSDNAIYNGFQVTVSGDNIVKVNPGAVRVNEYDFSNLDYQYLTLPSGTATLERRNLIVLGSAGVATYISGAVGSPALTPVGSAVYTSIADVYFAPNQGAIGNITDLRNNVNPLIKNIELGFETMSNLIYKLGKTAGTDYLNPSGIISYPDNFKPTIIDNGQITFQTGSFTGFWGTGFFTVGKSNGYTVYDAFTGTSLAKERYSSGAVGAILTYGPGSMKCAVASYGDAAFWLSNIVGSFDQRFRDYKFQFTIPQQYGGPQGAAPKLSSISINLSGIGNVFTRSGSINSDDGTCNWDAETHEFEIRCVLGSITRYDFYEAGSYISTHSSAIHDPTSNPTGTSVLGFVWDITDGGAAIAQPYFILSGLNITTYSSGLFYSNKINTGTSVVSNVMLDYRGSGGNLSDMTAQLSANNGQNYTTWQLNKLQKVPESYIGSSLVCKFQINPSGSAHLPVIQYCSVQYS